MKKRQKQFWKRLTAGLLSVAVVVSTVPWWNGDHTVEAVSNATLTVDMTAEDHEIVHGAAGFLYGVSSEDVPTTNTLTPLKPKILATKGALGTEHPYGDALDVAKTFLESGGEQVQMYNSNYYGVFDVKADYLEYAEVLETIIAPAVVEWKEAWKEEHGTPEAPKDNIGAQVDIDKAIVYLPINEGTPITGASGEWNKEAFSQAFEAYYKAIKAADPEASVGGPNDWNYDGSCNTEYFLTYCMENDCLPDVYTWHEMYDDSLKNMKAHVADFEEKWQRLVADEGGPEDVQIVINEYGQGQACGVPGTLVNWIARLEDEQLYGCLPFWHQANNLNDLAADANEGNGAWWLYKWYGDMSGNTLQVESSTNYAELYGLATIDDAKQSSTVLLGGARGTTNVILKNVDDTESFKNVDKVHVTVQATAFTGFHGAQTEPPTIIEGTFPVYSDGSVLVELKDMKAETAYNITITNAAEDDSVDDPMVSTYQKVYEAEDGILASGSYKASAGSYYLSGGYAVDMPQNAELTYTIEVPADGKYKLDYVYGNGTGTDRTGITVHSPQNINQTYTYDGTDTVTTTMKSTLLTDMTGVMTEYLDLTAGVHTIKIKTAESGTIRHDVLTVTYAGAYEQPVQAFDTIYEAEQADFNTLITNTSSSVVMQSELSGYSGSGYVNGLNITSVSAGGGVRWNVIVEESGLYDVSFRYQSNVDAKINVYVGNTATTLDKLTKTVALPQASGQWNTVNSTIYFQKGINIVDVDSDQDISLDYMRVRAIDEDLITGDAQSVTIEAEDCIPDSATEIEILTSEGASGGLYVTGLEGDEDAGEDANKYLEIVFDAPFAGTYEMQVFQSNDEICGTHAYNTKIIDKYATFEVQNNGQIQSANRYFFINTFSADTFKEKTISLELAAGENIIRIYNDDSWNVLWGGTQSEPGTNELKNYSPNFDKFVITPSTLDVAIELSTQYAIDIKTTEGGYAFANKNVAEEGDDFLITFYPETAIKKVLLNGEVVTEQVVGNQLQIENVTADQTVRVYFDTSSSEHSDEYIKNAGFGTGDVTDWTVDGDWVVEKMPTNLYEGYYLKLGGTLEQKAEGIPPGDYLLSVFSKAYNGDSGTGTVILTTGSNEVELSMTANYTENIMRVSVGADGILNIKVDATGLQDAYICLDNFSLIASTHKNAGNVNSNIEYFVDAGTKNPSALPGDEKLGAANSVTDQIFGIDSVTGYKWGLVYTDDDPVYSTSNGVNTKYQRAYENTTDTTDKNAYFRYACDQYEAGFTTRYIRYQFELDPGEYQIEVGFSNTWNNAYTPDLLVDNQTLGSANVPSLGYDVIKSTFTVANGQQYALVEANATSDRDPTIQMTYIKIWKSVDKTELQSLYDNYKDLTQDEYTDASWAALKDALKESSEILANEDAAQSEVNTAFANLKAAIQGLERETAILQYFVDAGTHNPSILPDNEQFGLRNSVTDQILGTDSETGYDWGLVYTEEDPVYILTNDGVATKYQRAYEGDTTGKTDKKEYFRFASGQYEDGFTTRYIRYQFELDPGEYQIEVGFSNTWNNAYTPDLLVDNQILGSANVPSMGYDVIKSTFTVAAGQQYALVEANATSDRDPTIQMTYIKIWKSVDKTELQNLYNEYKDLTQDKYTDASWAALEDALKEAFDVLADNNVNQSEVDTAFANLKGAIQGLETEPAVLESLQLEPPVKTTYTVGEELDLSGMSVKAIYSNGDSKDLAAGDYVVTGYDQETVGTQIITVSYTEGDITKIAEFTIAVAKAPPVVKENSITVKADGNGMVSINGSEPAETYTYNYQVGDTVTIEAQGETFRYWTNANNKVVSTKASFTITAATDEVYTAMFAQIRTISFMNNTQLIKTVLVAEDAEEVDFPETPFSYGHTFDCWDMDEEAILAALKTGDVIVRAVYTKSLTDAYSVYVTKGKTTGAYEALTLVTVTADTPPTGQQFSHWEDGDENIMSYKSTYNFYVTKDIELKAVFADEEEEVDKAVLIQITNVVPNQEANKLSFTAERALPVGVTLVQHGIILTADTSLDKDTFIIGAAGVLKGTATTTGMNGTYVLNKASVSSGDIWFARGYVIYKDADGVVQTTYTDIVSGEMP